MRKKKSVSHLFFVHTGPAAVCLTSSPPLPKLLLIVKGAEAASVLGDFAAQFQESNKGRQREHETPCAMCLFQQTEGRHHMGIFKENGHHWFTITQSNLMRCQECLQLCGPGCHSAPFPPALMLWVVVTSTIWRVRFTAFKGKKWNVVRCNDRHITSFFAAGFEHSGLLRHLEQAGLWVSRRKYSSESREMLICN